MAGLGEAAGADISNGLLTVIGGVSKSSSGVSDNGLRPRSATSSSPAGAKTGGGSRWSPSGTAPLLAGGAATVFMGGGAALGEVDGGMNGASGTMGAEGWGEPATGTTGDAGA